MSLYDDSFYDMINDGSTSSAQVVVPEVLSLYASSYGKSPVSVVDFGCGQGAWLRVFGLQGLSVKGFDGKYVDQDRLLIPSDRFESIDFGSTVPVLDKKYDIAMSLEVAEHIPDSRAASFVKALCAASDFVVFSAAIPGQGGVGHVNEQWPEYWADKFESEGYIVSGDLRWRIWDDDSVENWYRQNLLICSKKDIGLSPTYPSVIHPVLWDHHRSLR